MWKNREFKVGDEVMTLWGEGIIFDISMIDEYPIKVKTINGNKTFTLGGLTYEDHEIPTIFHRDNNPFEMAGKRQERNSITFGTNNTENQFPLQPIETPKPKIDRAELLEVAKSYAKAGLEPAMAVKGAVELLNEVNKVCDATT